MTLQPFLRQCQQWETERNLVAGLQACDDLLAGGARGRLRAAALRYKAVFLLMSNEAESGDAIGFIKEALDVARNHPGDTASLLNLLVAAYAMFGSCDFAQRHAEQFQELALAHPQDDVRKWTPKVCFNMGYCYDTAGEYALAARAYERARDTASLARGEFNPGFAEHNLVQVYLELGRTDDAWSALSRARRHLAVLNDVDYDKDQEAQCLLAMGQVTEAEAACMQALSKVGGQAKVQVEVQFTLSRIALFRGQVERAQTTAEQALDLAIALPNQRLVHKIGGFLRTLRSGKEVSREDVGS